MRGWTGAEKFGVKDRPVRSASRGGGPVEGAAMVVTPWPSGAADASARESAASVAPPEPGTPAPSRRGSVLFGCCPVAPVVGVHVGVHEGAHRSGRTNARVVTVGDHSGWWW